MPPLPAIYLILPLDTSTDRSSLHLFFTFTQTLSLIGNFISSPSSDFSHDYSRACDLIRCYLHVPCLFCLFYIFDPAIRYHRYANAFSILFFHPNPTVPASLYRSLPTYLTPVPCQILRHIFHSFDSPPLYSYFCLSCNLLSTLTLTPGSPADSFSRLRPADIIRHDILHSNTACTFDFLCSLTRPFSS